MRPKTRDEFEIAIICALTLEADAVEALFDEPFDKFGKFYGRQYGDQNAYVTGRIGAHNVVLCYLPGMGIGSAAGAAANLRVSYNRIQLALVVGICGAVPFPSGHAEIVKGDIIISDSVIEYDFGSRYPDGFRRKSDVKETLGRPSQEIRAFLAGLKGRKTRSELQEKTYKHLQTLQTLSGTHWQHPGTEHDVLFEASYRHKHYQPDSVTKCICFDCKSSSDPVCDDALKRDCTSLGCAGPLVQRSRPGTESVQPYVHIGTIASANTVMKSGEHRDKLAERENVLGFEMEGAGVWDNLPCIIIKGVSDYADSHKNEVWQDFAAATAASCAKAFLEIWPATAMKSMYARSWLVPFERNEDFVGRESQLRQLEESLFVDDRFSKTALFALGGMGKTSIAIELVYRVRDKYPSCSVFWVVSTSAESFEQSYSDIGQKLALPGIEDTSKDAKKLVMDYLNDENSGQWFMVFDNADNIDTWFKKSGINGSHRLADYVPRNRHGCALLTTRSETIARNFARHSVLKVPEMDMHSSLHLLGKALGQKEILGDDDTRGLLQKLFFIPLAIVQAGAYIIKNYITIPDYLSILNETEESLVEALSEDFEDDWRYQDQKNPIVTTWIVSFTQMQRQNSLAADYLSFISCIGPKSIPQTLLPPSPSSKQQLEAIACLISYSFLSKQVNNSFDVHQLVHLVTRNWLKEKRNYERYCQEAMSRFAEIFPTPDHANRDTWRTYLPHLKFTLSLDQAQIRVDYRLLDRYGQCLLSDGRYFDAESPFVEVVKTTKQIFGAEHPNTLNSMANLASTYCKQGRWKEAEELQVQVLETYKTVLGADHPDTLVSIGNLASTYRNQGRWKEAEELHVQVLETRKSVLGADHPNTLISMGNLASTYRNQGRWKEAEELQVQVLETHMIVLGADHPETLVSMGNLALIYCNQGRWKEAEELQAQVLETHKTVLGADHPGTLASMGNLASTYCKQGRWKEAEELQVQVLETYKTVLGADHPDTLISMGNLALTYWNQGRWKEAEELHVQVLETRKSVLGADHPNTLISMGNLASTYRNQGRWKEAEELQVQVLETHMIVLGADHPETLVSMGNLALIYWNQGRWKEAEELQAQVLETHKTVLGADHPGTLASMGNLASTYCKQGRWKEAEELQVQVLETYKTVLGADHPDTLISMGNLALTYWNQGRWKEAEELQAQVLETHKTVLGADHPETLISMGNLAFIWGSLGRTEDALSLMKMIQ